MGRKLLNATLLIIAVLGLLWAILPREPVDTVIEFDPATIGDDIDRHLAEVEGPFDDITPGVVKRVVWAANPGAASVDVIVYIHGFSATSEEIRPVPDRVAEALGANLLFWRLSGHGRGGDAMAEPSAGDWIEDTAHALAVAERLGDRVTVMSTSTGGTLAALAAIHPDLADKVDRLVFVSPNFQIAEPSAELLSWPGARYWVPVVAGAERSFAAINEAQGRYWTTQYPSVAAVPLGALVDYTRSRDFSRATQPALFVFSEDDRVVSPEATRDVAGRWGGDVTLAPQVIGETDDPFDHVIAGDILSPGMTDSTVQLILGWISEN